MYHPVSMVVMKPQFGRVSGLNGGVDTIKQAPPRIDSGIATTIPSRIAARCLWLANLSAMGTSVRFASSLNFSMKFMSSPPFSLNTLYLGKV